jgi:acid phosphatase
LAKEGILLTNYFGVTHPSEPNYCASAAGDDFGMDNDDWHQIPANVSTIADLFDTKGVAWGEYQEDLPYAGRLLFNPRIMHFAIGTSSANQLSLI